MTLADRLITVEVRSDGITLTTNVYHKQASGMGLSWTSFYCGREQGKRSLLDGEW